MRAAVFSYASVTHSTILSGSGEYSSSIEIAASGMFELLDRLEIRGKVDDAAAGRQVAVHLAVAIRDVNVSHSTAQFFDQAGRLLRQRQVRDIEVGLHGRPIDFVQKPSHARDVVQERKRKRLELERDLEAELGGMFAEGLHVLDRGFPLLLRAESLPSARCIHPGPAGRFSPRTETPCRDRPAPARHETAERSD